MFVHFTQLLGDLLPIFSITSFILGVWRKGPGPSWLSEWGEYFFLMVKLRGVCDGMSRETGEEMVNMVNGALELVRLKVSSLKASSASSASNGDDTGIIN